MYTTDRQKRTDGLFLHRTKAIYDLRTTPKNVQLASTSPYYREQHPIHLHKKG